MQVFGSETANFSCIETDILNRLPMENKIDLTEPHSRDSIRIKRLLRYNTDLEKQMDLIHLNENFIESKQEELESIMSVSDSIEQWSLARLIELALYCAGNYANNHCITEVGDFMINPRLILVHIKGEPFPVKKKRHMRLSEQFKSRGSEHCSTVEWLKLNTMIETVKAPILPHLLNLLEKNDCSRGYIDSVKKRMNMIVELTSYLSMARIPEETTIRDWKSSLEKNDREMMEGLFCRFDAAVFHNLGKKIRHTYEIGTDTALHVNLSEQEG